MTKIIIIKIKNKSNKVQENFKKYLKIQIIIIIIKLIVNHKGAKVKVRKSAKIFLNNNNNSN